MLMFRSFNRIQKDSHLDCIFVCVYYSINSKLLLTDFCDYILLEKGT